MLKKLKGKIKKLILIGFVCFNISPALFAYDELTEKKYKTFDGKTFEIEESAILHEKIQKKVDMIMEAFREDDEKLEQKTSDCIKNKSSLKKNYEYYLAERYLGEKREMKKLHKEYDNFLYKFLKKLEEKDIEIEIKLSKKSSK